MYHANKILIKNDTQKRKTEINKKSCHLHLVMIKLGRSPIGAVLYMTVKFQIKFKFVGK